MNTTPLRLGLACVALSMAAGSAAADTIFLLNGKSLADVTISGETFKEVEYKQAGKKKTVKTDDILRIEYSSKSQYVDRADAAAADDQLYDAIADLEIFVDGLESKGRPRYPWEPAYAMFRLVELNKAVGDAEKVGLAADQLIEKAPQSGYVPRAFLIKAEVQSLSGDSAGAAKTLKAFKDLIQGKTLSQRWMIEHRLASAMFGGSLKGKDLRDKLSTIAAEAGSAFPQVKNRAEVSLAESLLENKVFSEAEPIFKRITSNPKAEAETLAAAYTGLGDCVFKRAVALSPGKEKDDLLRAAKLAYMRVVVVYKDQTRYVSKAMFWAGRVFDATQEEDDAEYAQKLYAKVLRYYPESKWAAEARGFRKR